VSTILDALRKSELQRRLGRAPVYRNAAAGAEPVLLRWVSLAAAILLVVALGSVAWVVYRPPVLPAGDAGRLATEPGQPREAATSTPSPDVQQPTLATSTPELAEQLPGPPAAKALPDPPTRVARPVASGPVAPEKAPWLSSLPAAFRQQLPVLVVNIHVYAPGEAQRILYINNHPYRRGEQIPGGVLVEDILPDGVLLQAHGQRFKLPRPT